MEGQEVWTVALLVATALHAGFQLTVTLVVYPALAAVPEAAWREAHASHSRRIAPLVLVVYAAALPVAVGAVLAVWSAGAAAALAGTVTAVLVTAVSAAPTHSRLGHGRDDDLVRRLRRADRWRCLAAVLACGGAIGSAL